jgi:hypothetical protein
MSLQSGMTESVQIWAEMSSLSYLALLAVESSYNDNKKVIENLISFT